MCHYIDDLATRLRRIARFQKFDEIFQRIIDYLTTIYVLFPHYMYNLHTDYCIYDIIVNSKNFLRIKHDLL